MLDVRRSEFVHHTHPPYPRLTQRARRGKVVADLEFGELADPRGWPLQWRNKP